MKREEMIAAVDGEVSRLERIRDLLSKSHSERFTLPEVATRIAERSNKRVISPSARRGIALAPKRSWAKQKRGAAASALAK